MIALGLGACNQAACRIFSREQKLKFVRIFHWFNQNCSGQVYCVYCQGKTRGGTHSTPVILQVAVQEGNQLGFREGTYLGGLNAAVFK